MGAVVMVCGLLAAGLANAAAPLSQTALTTGAGPLQGSDPGVLQVPAGPDAGWYVYSTDLTGNRIDVAEAGAASGRYGAPAAALAPQAWFGAHQPLDPQFASHDLWAPAVTAIGGQYVMYFAAWDPNASAQCVGVATAPHPLGPFALVPSSNPICAPAQAGWDGQPAEAIDPSSYVTATGQRYLIFKAGTEDRYNVGIWALPMQPDGETPGPGAPPQLVLGAKGPGLPDAIENPDLIAHGGRLYLFVSSNYFANCFYETDVYSATNLTGFSRRATPIHLLTSGSTGLCGPGGASVTPDGQTIVYHAWDTDTPTPYTYTAGPNTPRLLYSARLSWSAAGPAVS